MPEHFCGAIDGKSRGGLDVGKKNFGCEKKRNRRRDPSGGVLRKGFCFQAKDLRMFIG